MKKLWSDDAWNDYQYWQTQDSKTIKKINSLLKDIDRNGYNCSGKLEPLKENLFGWWSVRIDNFNRLIFKIDNHNIEIYSCKGHY